MRAESIKMLQPPNIFLLNGENIFRKRTFCTKHVNVLLLLTHMRYEEYCGKVQAIAKMEVRS